MTPQMNKKKGRNKMAHHADSSPGNLEMTLQPHEINKFILIPPCTEEGNGNKPIKLSLSDPIPITSQEDNKAIDPVSPQKKNTSTPEKDKDKEKDDKAIFPSLPVAVFRESGDYENQIGKAEPLPNSYVRFMERSGEELDGEVEYDLDEEDSAWLAIVNERRLASGLSPPMSPDVFELLMDRLEKESFFQQQTSGSGGGGVSADEDAVCCICMDGECQNSNAILFCDMCNLAVHQDCYGVPYIPEGQWLCRRCLQSPSAAVSCVLCPNRGGAFKQTDRPSMWAHVVCALWIPEVRFANTVFLEPIDSIESIPHARWKLPCSICKRRNAGACIQCHKSNCYAAFHVTCAQQAGLYMRMHSVQPSEGEPVLVQKTAWCETHAPPDYQPSINPTDAKRRAIANKKSSAAPVISIPTISLDRIREIARQNRNGVPLLRRLQSSHTHSRTATLVPSNSTPPPDGELSEMYRQLRYWQSLRQDLERARLLCELVRKREKLKKEQLKTLEQCIWHEIHPLESLLLALLQAFKAKDTNEIFTQPVDTDSVKDYLDIVSHPMDLSTMEAKLENKAYDSLSAFEADFMLMVNNCLEYNRKDTMFYRAGARMREYGTLLFEQSRREKPELDVESKLEQAAPKARKRDRNTRNRAEVESRTNEKDGAASGGVNRRTAVLFTRKARARASRGEQVANSDGDQKKQADSFRVYRSGMADSDVGEGESQTSSCSSCLTSRSNSPVPEGEESVEEPKENGQRKLENDGSGLEDFTLVWAKCRGYPWYPALTIDPEMPRGTVHKGVPLPAPPEDVLALRENHKDHVYLVLFFDTKRTWQWLPGEKLEKLGESKELDDSKLIESRKPADRKAVKKAYQDALDFRKETHDTISKTSAS